MNAQDFKDLASGLREAYREAREAHDVKKMDLASDGLSYVGRGENDLARNILEQLH